MPDSESFDAFYARTVWNVTSQMHALAGEDSAADHAIREAYAKAYQQWFEIAGRPDPEGWVLAVAKEAYQRRRPEAAPRLAPAGTGHDSLSWPGLYRPAAAPGGTPADPAANAGGPIGLMAGEPAGGGVGLVADPADALAPPQGDHDEPGRPGKPGSRSRLIALAAAIAVIVGGGIGYLATSRQPAAHAGHHSAANSRKPAVQMLGAGRTGTRGQIPWTIVGSGWTLAEVSAAPAASAAAGPLTTYLVDPKGGRYQIQTSSPGGAARLLLAWSGDGQNALYAVAGSAGSATYEILSLTTGDMTVLALPAGVTAVGFSRPEGFNILAVRQTQTAYRLQRYNLQGEFQATIGTLPRKAGSPNWQPQPCGLACGALSSPDGQLDVWGVTGDQMQLVSNAGGVIRRLNVPDGGKPPSCVPLTWWNTTTVLADCGVSGQPSAGSLWLVPADGSTPTQLTAASGSASGQGWVTGAWQVAGSTYATVTDFRECPTAASGPGGLAVVPVSGGSLQQPLTVQGATNNHTSIVSASGGKLLVLAQTSCPGTSSLLWLNPTTGSTTNVLTVPAGQAGVLAAVPYGLGPTATIGQ